MKQAIIDYGLISSIGAGKTGTAENLFSDQRSGLIPYSMPGGKMTFAGSIRHQLEEIPEAFAKLESRNNRLLLSVFKQIEATYLEVKKDIAQDRIGIVIGTSTSGIADVEKAFEYKNLNGYFPENYHYKKHEMASPSEFLAAYLGTSGPVYTVSCACSSGSKALASASRLLSSGICDLVITGGVDTLCNLTLLGFDSLEVISKDPCLPFSKNRKGINIGEAGALFLMSNNPGKLNLLGCGESSDAYHHSAPEPDGKGAQSCMENALKAAGLQAKDIDYINLHGTGTLQNDAMEAKAVQRIFGRETPCSSTKPLTGHTLGAAGAIEAAFSLLALEEGRLIKHHWDNEADCDLNLICSSDRKIIQNVLSSSYAFGGNNCSLIFGVNS